MSASLTIRPAHWFPTGQVALLEALGLCLPGVLLVVSLGSHEWWTGTVALLILVGLIVGFARDWSRAAITIEAGQILVSSLYGFRRVIPVRQVDRMLQAATCTLSAARGSGWGHFL